MSARPAPQVSLAPGATFKLVGLGGVGGIVARYLLLFLRSLHTPVRVVFLDGDAFEQGNARRMAFHRTGNKAEVLREQLLPLLDGSQVSLEAIGEYLTPESLPRLVRAGDTLLLAVDNHATRKLVSDFVAGLPDAALFSGGNDGAGPDSLGVERAGTYGNVQIQLRHGGRDASPALTAFHPEIAQPADRRPDEQDCLEAMESTPQLLFANLQVASCLLSALWLQLCGQLHYGELAFDIHEGRMAPSGLPGPLPAGGAATGSPR